MKHVKNFDGFLNEANGAKVKTTVNDLFTWYMGDDWKNEWQITNTMTVDGEHAQDLSKDGVETLKFLADNAEEAIEVHNELPPPGNAYDVIFMLKGKEFLMQAAEAFK
jgi:hypothetical protein